MNNNYGLFYENKLYSMISFYISMNIDVSFKGSFLNKYNNIQHYMIHRDIIIGSWPI
jgi:hypothetical protein